MIEDSLVIYRLSRAPERRIFYIDVGNLPKVKAEQYLRDVMMRYRNKLVYDASTERFVMTKNLCQCLRIFGYHEEKAEEVLKFLLFLEDRIWVKSQTLSILRRSYTGHSTSPPSRMDGEGGFNLGRSS